MIMRGGKNGSTQKQTCLSTTFITTNSTRTELVSKQGLQGKRFLLKKTAQLSQKISAILWTLVFHHRVNNSQSCFFLLFIAYYSVYVFASLLSSDSGLLPSVKKNASLFSYRFIWIITCNYL